MIELASLFSPYELLIAYAALLLGACFLLIAPLFAEFNNGALKSISISSILVAIGVFIYVGTPEHAGGFFGLYAHDSLSFYASLLILACSALCILLRSEPFLNAEYLALFLFMITCLLIMVSSDNLVMIFTSLEGSSLALYALIAHKNKATNAALGYFNYGMLGSAFFAMASALYYYETGSLFLGSAKPLNSDLLGALISVMFLCVVLYKLSIAPFHLWLAKVYEAAEGSMAGFVSVVPKIAMMVFAFKLTSLGSFYVNAALIIACIAMLYASAKSFKAIDAKSLLVFSSISHSAFALIAAVLNEPAGFIYYFAVFGFINIALFSFLNSFREAKYTEFGGLLKSYPFISIFAVIMLLDLAALPPFGVFFAKVMVIKTALSAHFVCASIIMALSSVIMLFAYLRFIASFFKPSQNPAKIYFSLSAKIGLYIALIASIFAAFSADFIFESVF